MGKCWPNRRGWLEERSLISRLWYCWRGCRCYDGASKCRASECRPYFSSSDILARGRATGTSKAGKDCTCDSEDTKHYCVSFHLVSRFILICWWERERAWKAQTASRNLTCFSFSRTDRNISNSIAHGWSKQWCYLHLHVKSDFISGQAVALNSSSHFALSTGPRAKGKLFIIQSEEERKSKSHQRQHQLHIKKFSSEQWICHEHHLCLPAEPRSQGLTNHWGQSSRMDDHSAATII